MPNFALRWLINAYHRRGRHQKASTYTKCARLIIASRPVLPRACGHFAGVGLAALGSGYGLAEATVAVDVSAARDFAPKPTPPRRSSPAAEGATWLQVRIDATHQVPRPERSNCAALAWPPKPIMGGKKLDARRGRLRTHDLGFL